MVIRPYHPADAQVILDIYRPFIEDGPVTFETEVPELSAFTERLNRIAAEFPLMVLDDGTRILGYAYASRYRERAAYRWHVETSIYMAPEARGKGLGKMLYLELLKELKKRGFTRAYAIIGHPNDPSEKLHQRCGFDHLVLHTEAGWKQGAWRDVLWMTCPLHQAENPPAEPVFAPLERIIHLG